MLIERPDWWDEWVDKYLPKCPLNSDEVLEQLHIKCRELAANYLEQRTIVWLVQHKVKDFKCEFKEYSNGGPYLEIKIKNKRNDWYDTYWLYFDRNNWYNHIQIWLPKGKFYCVNDKHSKANWMIIQQLNKDIDLDEIKQLLNFPFKCPWRTIT